MNLGTVTLDRIRDAADLRRSLRGWLPVAESVIVKPNWYSPHPANFTDAHALGLLMDAVDARFTVVEGYSLDRQDGSLKYTVNGEEVDWRWIMRHPDWGWIMEGGHLELLRTQDRWFMETHGFTDLLDTHDAEYVNVTEEIWGGRVLDPRIVQEKVESIYPPARSRDVYGFMPRRLADMEGSTLISLGRVKGYGGTYPSLTVKNMFGLIPDPMRSWWHGHKDERLNDSIVDAVKLYASYFTLYGVCEAFRNLTVSDPQGEVKTSWGCYGVRGVEGFAVHGPNLIDVDAVTCGLIDVDPGKVGYISVGEKALGAYDRDASLRAAANRGKYISP
ncbi:hypothetical protein A3K69_05825 [Candidatus Bathyarchaeota archaeon RBG_16_57_9]|nr:MAG: hypothetical protein A3K69_05825 [Candidatus Bathyarchaeota archaeon RBG_16_57_9]OGD53976.1 MAG: hypothetical protein A3K81_00495 [Candidatus Bathyarchaeota archaeon RBG_13_60_20]